MTDQGKRIRDFRKLQELSQAQMGELLGVNQRKISYWENNQYEIPEEYVKVLNNIINKNTKNPNNIFNNNYGKKIKEFRKVNEISQSQMAKLLGTSQKSISYWETGRFNPSEKYTSKIDNIINNNKKFYNNTNNMRFRNKNNIITRVSKSNKTNFNNISKNNNILNNNNMLNTQTDLGNTIYQFRKDNKLTRKDLSEMIGCSEVEIYRWEKHISKKPHIAFLRKLASTVNKHSEKLGYICY